MMMNKTTAMALLLFGIAACLAGGPALAVDDPPLHPEAADPNGPAQDAPTGSLSEHLQDSPAQPSFRSVDMDVSTAESTPPDPADLIGEIVRLREALLRQPESNTARVNLASALYRIGDLDSAIETYREALRREPARVDAHVQLAAALMARREWGGAHDELLAALALQPDLARAYDGLGAVRYALGDHDGAIEAYRQVLRLRPDYADAHYRLGLVLKLTGQDQSAAAEFLAAAASGVPQAQYFIGSAYASGAGVERDLAAAVAWWLRAADQNVAEAKEAVAHLRRATLLKGSPSAVDARAAFAAVRRSLWRAFPDLPADGDDSVGVSLLRQGRGREAVPLLIREAGALSDPAQSALEVLYEQGIPGQIEPYDPRILAYWLAAAEEGLPRPRMALARVYSRGFGVPADLSKAAGLLKNLPGAHAKELLQEISARQHNGAPATRNARSEWGPSP